MDGLMMVGSLVGADKVRSQDYLVRWEQQKHRYILVGGSGVVGVF